MSSIIRSDILSTSTHDFTVICHQVNCRGVAGAGLAKQIRDTYPGWYDTYRAVASADMLGVAQFTPTTRDYSHWICNLYGQDNFGRDRQYTDYDALRSALGDLREWVLNFASDDYEIRIPYGLGCGLAGGQWPVVLHIIQEELAGLNYNFYTRT